VSDPTKQRHDWEPGIAPSGLFWTIPVSPSAVSYDAATGRARFRMSGLALNDYGNFSNATSKRPKNVKPAHATFDVLWHGTDDVQQVRDAKFGFSGTFASGNASITFTTKNAGSPIVYRSEPSGSTALYAGSGMERNGVFFV
jgi:hypothetical protein